MNMNIGENIVRYRKSKGILQKYIADKTGISQQGLHKIEKGQVSPRADTLVKVIDVLGITPNQLFGVEEIPND